MKVLYRPEFWADVEETMVYLAREASERVALKWQDAVKSGVDKIIGNPGRGHLRRDLKPEGVRAISVPPFHKHLIFYRWSQEGNEIEFYRVRHGAMNLPLLFESGGD
ncbi:MAG TPA: type II toxin-antitoxin system RelE/ParE family toxin [Dongiaceae bacterium]|nr:type II toxin-antitoxin system RelE/ParE family toxin [Dongiaceae bacterium]